MDWLGIRLRSGELQGTDFFFGGKKWKRLSENKKGLHFRADPAQIFFSLGR